MEEIHDIFYGRVWHIPFHFAEVARCATKLIFPKLDLLVYY